MPWAQALSWSACVKLPVPEHFAEPCPVTNSEVSQLHISAKISENFIVRSEHQVL